MPARAGTNWLTSVNPCRSRRRERATIGTGESSQAGALHIPAPAPHQASAGIQSPCAVSSSSTIATICSGSSTAAVCGSSIAAW